MKLFLLLIPVFCINCLVSTCRQTKHAVPAKAKEAVTYQLLPSNLFIDLN